MQSFKKAFIAIIIVFALVVAGSIGVMTVAVNCEYERYDDRHLRDSLAGKLDFLICGASETQRAVIPSMLDKGLGVKSYNLSEVWQNLYSQKLILSRELSRNDVKVVVLDLSRNTLCRDEDIDQGQGDLYALPRLAGPGERLDYLWHSCNITEWPTLGLNLMQTARNYFLASLHGYDTCNVPYEAKGYDEYVDEDLSLTDDEAIALRGTSTLAPVREENIEQFKELVNMCKEHGAYVICMWSPEPASLILKNNGYQDIHDANAALCRELDVPYYDFNLMNNRFVIFDDSYSFCDYDHLGPTGGKAFMPYFIEMINHELEGAAMSYDFYSDYNQMMLDSPYPNQ